MSGVVKGVGKVFKKVMQVQKKIRKIALPVLAVAAVVMTGGAALGVLPAAGVGSIAGSLGLSAGMTSILTSAAQAATMGAATSALTGGNIVKGATRGFVVGGALGAVGALSNPALAKTATSAAQGGDAAATAATAANAGAPAMSMDELLAWKPTGVPISVGSAVPAGTPGIGGALSFLNDPLTRGAAIQGVGTALMASAQAKEARRAREEEAASYDVDPSSLYGGTQTAAAPFQAGRSVPLPYANASYVYDKNSGQIRLVQGG